MARADYPQPVTELISALKKLPGIGPRSAERIGVWLLQHPRADPTSLAAALKSANERVCSCRVCGFFATQESCPVCDDGTRDTTILCIVEQPTDVLPLERSGAFRGMYHCLGGKLSPLDNIGPDDLRLSSLLERLSDGRITEVILAVSSDVEGEATANYLSDILAPKEVTLTRIAQGLPAGGGLEYADELTLTRALQGRRAMGE